MTQAILRPEPEVMRAAMAAYVHDKAQQRIELGLQVDACVRIVVTTGGAARVAFDINLRPDRAPEVTSTPASLPQEGEPLAAGVDAEAHVGHATFAQVLAGHVTPHVAYLRGDITARGDMRALLRFGVLFG